MEIPTSVFLVPYRNRAEQKFFFSNYMTQLLGNKKYEIYFVHQNDTRSFNRGAMKNIGFLAIKAKYPNHYQDMNIVFNDVDTLPFNNIFDYETTEGTVKHYYGFTHALGGIVVFKGGDFEKINGFPNCWGWGGEDSGIQKRCIQHNLTIDRSDFKEIGNPQILQLFDGVERIINRSDYISVKYDLTGKEGLMTIYNPVFTIDDISKNDKDNIHLINNEKIFVVNVDHFMCGIQYDKTQLTRYDIRDPKYKLLNPKKHAHTIVSTTNDWKNIKYKHIKAR